MCDLSGITGETGAGDLLFNDIERRARQRGVFVNTVYGRDGIEAKDATIARLTAELAAEKKRADAAECDLQSVCLSGNPCVSCKSLMDKGPDYPCGKHAEWCGGVSWEWRGPCALQGDEKVL